MTSRKRNKIGSWLAPTLTLMIAACATPDIPAPPAQPSAEEVRTLLARELAVDSRFDSFANSTDAAAHRLAAVFRPEVTEVLKFNCRAAADNAVDCMIGIVLRFPALDARESRVVWERRFVLTPSGWAIVSALGKTP